MLPPTWTIIQDTQLKQYFELIQDLHKIRKKLFIEPSIKE